MRTSDPSSIDDLLSYEEVCDYLAKAKRPKHLLLGNGFSMAYDDEIFSYNALSKFIDRLDDELLKKLFEIVNEKDFEVVMRQLDNFIELATAFSKDTHLVERLRTASVTLKESLINAVRKLHPEHVFKVPEDQSKQCATFLNQFLANGGKIFTTNYDLLLYWVLMRNGLDGNDGFGKEFEGFDFNDQPEFADLAWGKHRDDQNIFYLHGALHLFDTGVEIEKEIYDSEHLLLEKISERIDSKDFPIFVAAGDGREKMEHISHNKYLIDAFDKFSSIIGSLIVFGFGFGTSDEHIIDAINKAAHHGAKTDDRLWSVYIGVYSQRGLERMQRIKDKFQCKVNFFDARTAGVWK